MQNEMRDRLVELLDKAFLESDDNYGMPCVSYLLCDDDGWSFGCEHINRNYNLDDIGEKVFLTKEEAEQKLKGGVDNG